MRQALRREFFSFTGKTAFSIMREPNYDYVLWLEEQLIMQRESWEKLKERIKHEDSLVCYKGFKRVLKLMDFEEKELKDE